jgi:hypothetical protein
MVHGTNYRFEDTRDGKVIIVTMKFKNIAHMRRVLRGNFEDLIEIARHVLPEGE